MVLRHCALPTHTHMHIHIHLLREEIHKLYVAEYDYKMAYTQFTSETSQHLLVYSNKFCDKVKSIIQCVCAFVDTMTDEESESVIPKGYTTGIDKRNTKKL